MKGTPRLAILLSGRGSNFLAIHDAIRAGRLEAEICCVLSNVGSAPGLAHAKERDLNGVVLEAAGMGREDYDRRLVGTLSPHRPDLVCLAGYMRILTPVFLQAYPGRVLNIHPSLLPAFPGLHAQRQALEHGVKVSGCTVHFVDEGVDTGPILLQRAVAVLESDTEESLSARILEQEHDLYWRAIAAVLKGTSRRHGRRVLLDT